VLVFALPVLAGFSAAAAAISARSVSAAFLGLAGAVVVVFSTETFVLFGRHVPAGPWLGIVVGGAAVFVAAFSSARFFGGQEGKPSHRG